MRKHTIKWRILKYNLAVIVLLIALTTIIFNVAVRFYMEKDIVRQLNNIADQTENIALQRGPDFFPDHGRDMLPHPNPGGHDTGNGQNRGKGKDDDTPFRYYFLLDRALREPLSVLSADYILLDSSKKIINPSQDEFFKTSTETMEKITAQISKNTDFSSETNLNFRVSGTDYTAILKPVSDKNSFGLGWIIIYSSLQKVNQLQWVINLILLAILLLSALIIVVISSIAAKKISAPFSSLNQHLGAIAERNFAAKLQIPVDDELQEFVNNINLMSEKLESYDQAQKTFLQNASHEFRTPLMSIQSYAEGIKYEVVDTSTAADVIIDETKRMTHLVEDLLYLSRLDTIEENYHLHPLDAEDFLKSCVDRMNGIAIKNNIKIAYAHEGEKISILADEEKLSRAVTNLISNCIRFASATVTIRSMPVSGGKLELVISDDGPGFEKEDLPHLFDRFYIGKKGNFGLGLAISKNVVEKHGGTIAAENASAGALFRVVLPVCKLQ